MKTVACLSPDCLTLSSLSIISLVYVVSCLYRSFEFGERKRAKPRLLGVHRSKVSIEFQFDFVLKWYGDCEIENKREGELINNTNNNQTV
ncbi:hypothetical protein Syun_014815 [Stephania yunnanensis]|uniref:Uncharacterized protein n=1 Tax=Stephania yunnanensis TaxID=152371 RepID=A0AAP0JKW9_9MAGN